MVSAIKNPKIVIQVLGLDSTWQDIHTETLINPTYTIGRSNCDISLRRLLDYSLIQTISSIQCSLYRRPASAKELKPGIARYIEPGYDCRDGEPNKPSLNGCYHNNARIVQKIQLRSGDTVRLSRNVRFIYISETASIANEIEDTLIDPKEAAEYLEYLKTKNK